MEQTDHEVDILILGGGLAGLGAAIAISKEKKIKCSYLILEAQSHAGGRVRSEELRQFSLQKPQNGTKELRTGEKCEKRAIIVDCGAQWLHGRNNLLYTIADNYNLLTADQSDEGLGGFFYNNSEQIDPLLVKKVDFHIGQLLQECEEFVHNIKNKSCPKSVGHFLRERFQIFVDSLENVQTRQQAKDLFDWHIRFQMIDNSCLTLDHLSAKYYGSYSFNGEPCQAHYNFKYGFKSLIDCLINDISMNSICFKKEVIEIQIHDKQTATNCNKSSKNIGKISVKCSDGSVYLAKAVLITFSLGVLKNKHKTLFRPPLPRSIRNAIECIGYETINKIFLEFETPWWDKLNGIQFVFQHRDEKLHWTQYLTGFDVLKTYNGNILLGWVGGNGAIQMETFTDVQIVEDCVLLLTEFTNINVPYPIRYYCTRWHSNPFILGAYSYISTECDNNRIILDKLLSRELKYHDFYSEGNSQNDGKHKSSSDSSNKNKNSVEPVILFAGEACHEKYFSTAHGAFLSGVEQAQKINNFFKQSL